MTDILKKVLEAAIWAPSGENSQPWKFVTRDDEIDLHNRPENDLSLYNYRQKGSLVAHGAVLENMSLAAAALGHRTDTTLFPQGQDSTLVARVKLVPDPGATASDLAAFIPMRATNRKPYDTKNLTDGQKRQLLESVAESSGVRLVIAEGQQANCKLASAVSVNEFLLFDNPELHEFFFTHVRWTEEEDKSYSNGFYVKALELKPSQVIAFKVFRNPKIMSFLRRLGFAKAAGKANIKTYQSSGAWLGFVADGNSPVDFINVGRASQRCWLTLTKLGLSAQPATGALFFMQRIMANDPGSFTRLQVERIKQSYNDIAQSFGVKQGTMAMLFRVGVASPPTARSSRFDLRKVWEPRAE